MLRTDRQTNKQTDGTERHTHADRQSDVGKNEKIINPYLYSGTPVDKLKVRISTTRGLSINAS